MKKAYWKNKFPLAKIGNLSTVCNKLILPIFRHPNLHTCVSAVRYKYESPISKLNLFSLKPLIL